MNRLRILTRAEPATLTPTLSQRAREGATTFFLSLLRSRKALTGLCLLGLFAQTLSAVDTTGARPGTWTYSLTSARQLADTTDRPLIVMFTQSSATNDWCKRFESQINSSDIWNAYAAEQQLAMALQYYHGPNWDERYYQKVVTNNPAITGFPAFVVYASDGVTVLDSFSYNSSNLVFTASAFKSKINTILSNNGYLVDGRDLWDPADNTAVGATLLDFKTFNVRQYHDLNKTADDTDDWFKFLSVSGRRYLLQIPGSDYQISFSKTIATNRMTAVTNSFPTQFATYASFSAFTTNRSAVVTNIVTSGSHTNFFFHALTNSLPFSLHLVTNAVVASATTKLIPVMAGSTSVFVTNLPSAAVRAFTNGTPPELISPTLSLFDPTRQTRLDFDAGPLGITNQLMIASLTNGCLFSLPEQYDNNYCFLEVNQVISNTPPSFSAVVYQPLQTNLTVSTTVSNLSQSAVTYQTLSNVWFSIGYTGPFTLPTGQPAPFDTAPGIIISSNVVVEISNLTITNTDTTPLAYTRTNSVISEGSNFVTYAYERTRYTLNYRLWDPGTVGFVSTNVQTSETMSSVRLTVIRRGGASTGELRLRYGFEDADTPGRDYEARNGKDFKAVAGELFWADGQSGSTNITVDLIQDLRPTWDGKERFAVVLSKHENADYLQAPINAFSNAVVSLLESDKKSPGTLGFSQYEPDDAADPMNFPNASKPALAVTEGHAVTLWVARTGGSDGPVRVSVTTVNGAAQAPADFDALSQTLEWANGETDPKPVTLQTVDRAPFNRDATFTVKLVNELDAVLSSAASVTVTLRDKAIALSLADTAAAAALRGAAFKAGAGNWFWSDPDTLRCDSPARTGASSLSLAVTGPGVLTFDWGMDAWAAPDKLVCAGGVVIPKTLAAETGTTTSVLVKPGKQTVTWTFTKASPVDASVDAFAFVSNLSWQPMTRAADPEPSNNARTYSQDFTWQIPGTSAIRLGGDFDIDTSAGLVQTATVKAVNPAGNSLAAVTAATFEELWNSTAPSVNRGYTWRVDTVFENADGRLTYTGTPWSFTAISPVDSEATMLPPNGPESASGAYEAIQGVRCDFGAITDDTAVTYAVTGGSLPNGLTLNKANGQISGVPTKAGTWSPVLQATATVGGRRVSYATVSFSIIVHPLGTFIGTYDGWIKDGASSLNYGGAVTLTLSDSGKLTAKVTAQGGTYTFSATALDSVDDITAPAQATLATCAGGAVSDSGGNRFTHTLDSLVISSDGTAQASLTLYTLVQNGGGTTAMPTVYEVKLFRNNWAAAALQPTLNAFKGYYTVSLPVTGARDVDNTPWGSGYILFTVAADGGVKASGVLADGKAWSLAAPLLLLDTNDASVASVYVFAQPSDYAKKGGFSGLFHITAGASVYGNTVDCSGLETLQWWNFTPASVFGATNTTPSDASGFLNSLGAAGGFYDTVMNLQTYYLCKQLSFQDAANFPAVDRLPADYDGRNGASGYMLLSDGGMLPFGTNILVGARSLSAVARSVVSNSTDAASMSLLAALDFDLSRNVSGLTLSLTRSTGLLSGSFNLVYERKNANAVFARHTRKVTYKGVYTPLRPGAADPSEGVQGEGFYLLPDTGSSLDSSGRTVTYAFNWSFAFELFSLVAHDTTWCDGTHD